MAQASADGAQTSGGLAGAEEAGAPARRRALLAALACNVLEWFDFAVYGLLAAHIARAFFSQDSAQLALLNTLALYGVSFVMRPVGALALGGLADRVGRKPALVLAAGLMAAATFAIGLLPTQAQVGLLAPLLLLAARLAQGFSAGGEFGVANAFLLEWAPKGRRGFSASFLAVTVALGTGLASLLIALLSQLLPPEQMELWGWRVPFLFGGLLGLAALWLRARIDETPVFAGTRPRAAPDAGLARVRRPALSAIGLTVHWTVCYYIFLIYLPLMPRGPAGASIAQARWGNVLSLATVIVLVPLVGRLSDRYGRRPFLIASCLLAMLVTVPAMAIISGSDTTLVILAMQFVLGLTIALYSGAAPAALGELFSTRDRSRWSAVSYALATAVFGGFAPFVAVWLTGVAGTPLAPAGYVVLASLLSLLTVLRMPETAHRPVA